MQAVLKAKQILTEEVAQIFREIAQDPTVDRRIEELLRQLLFDSKSVFELEALLSLQVHHFNASPVQRMLPGTYQHSNDMISPSVASGRSPSTRQHFRVARPSRLPRWPHTFQHGWGAMTFQHGHQMEFAHLARSTPQLKREMFNRYL